MKSSKISEAKIFEILKEGEAGLSIDELCRKYSIARSTYYKLRNRYGGMELSDLKRLKQLEEENRQLKAMYADLSLEHKVMKDVIEKKLRGQLSEEKL
jgi:putative transposase